ncbi:FAD-dependent oxidoreductase [Aureimonas fodinaquatilis]|uniref:FAD-dependent oxidoreductase n=1 Tax=Aureimonas fodinaquatilis TaxID=2565783 RepID=A0A5B0E2M1_9HYPH|nr:FAD-dependent monooxygenase [Aureimonas fodinaquatilis]KAA0972201.1 FAD-dependent oxidoreductase [Aureimonas fodinaquatilis]
MRDEVLIAGAGPTGLTLALWLTMQGVKVRIIDKAPGPGQTSRAMVVQARTLELYRQADMAEAVVAAGHPNPAINLWIEGKRQAHIDFAGVGQALTPYPYVLVYPQDQHEKMLEEQLARRGVMVERDTALISFEDKGDWVEAVIETTPGERSIAQALYLAGCDGARSVVRQKLNIAFPGGTYDRFYYVADVNLSGPVADGQIHVVLDHADFLALLSYGPSGEARLIGTLQEQPGVKPEDLTFADVAHRAMEGMQLSIDKVNWFSTYRAHHRVVDSFRKGRVFLAGDAAHIHSPAGGQGMNTGIGDAINLAWKLAAVLGGKAPDRLLDTYQSERRAFAVQLVATTDRVFTLATSPGNLARFVRTRIAPLVVPLAGRLEKLRERLFRVLSQTMLNYRQGPLSAGVSGSVQGGERLPWVHNPRQDNYASLNALGWQIHVYGRPGDALQHWCADNSVPLHVFGWDDTCANAGFVSDTACLLRPDTYIALVWPAAEIDALQQWLNEQALDITPWQTEKTGDDGG